MDANDDFDARYELRVSNPQLDAEGAPTAETLDVFNAVGLGFHEPTPETPKVARWVEDALADRQRCLGVYRRTPLPGTVDERWPVGTFASYPKHLSWGDGAGITAAAITAVTVRPTERRRGILRRMMTSELAHLAAEGYALATLTASEATIYRRFGFGAALRKHVARVRRERALPLMHSVTGVTTVVTPEWLADGVAREVFDRFHRQSPGSLVRDTGTWRVRTGTHDRTGKPTTEVRAAVYRAHDTADAPIDGYVTYRVDETDHEYVHIDVIDLVYTTDEAYLGLWEYLLSIDLNDGVNYPEARADDPIIWAFHDSRAYDVVHEEDHIWLRVLDPVAVLESRPWAADGTLVFQINDALGYAAGATRLLVDGGHGTAERLSADTTDAGASPDNAASRSWPATVVPSAGGEHIIRLDVADFSALLIGAVDPSSLAAAGLLEASSPEALQTLRATLRPSRIPHGITFF